MSFVQAVVLGVIQGLTEFLPISSSGHLALLETLLGFNASNPEILLFDLATHLGTLASVGIVFRRSLRGLIASEPAIAEAPRGLADTTRSVTKRRLLLMIGVATGTTALVVMPARAHVTQAFGNLTVIGMMWIVTGTLLWVTDVKGRGRFGLDSLGVRGAFAIGLAQAIAVMPGISRSGATICAAILIGLWRTDAIAFSLLIGVPAIFGAALMEGIDEWEVLTSGNLPIWAMLVGGAVAAVVGVIAIRLLVRCACATRLRYLGLYCCLLGLFSVLWVLAG